VGQNLQKQMAENSVNASIEVAQLTKKVEEQSCKNEVTVKVLDNLTQKIDQLSGNLSTIQADLQRWKQAEAEYDAGNVEEDMTDVGNATASVPMSVTPLTTTPSFVFGETAEIQPTQPTVSQTVPVPTTVPPLFIDLAVRVKTEDSDFSPSYFTAPKFVATPGSRFLGIPAEEVPRIGENANVPSGNVTSTGQAFLPPEAQKTISEICE
jgi:hypothetical protein